MGHTNRFITIIVLIALLFSACRSDLPGSSSPTQPPRRILFIGSSHTAWNLGLDKHMAALAQQFEPPMALETASLTVDFATLEQLWQHTDAIAQIQQGAWDMVVLQEYDMVAAGDPEKFYEFARKFDAEIRKAGAQTLFYMTWQSKVQFVQQTTAPTTEALAQAYTQVGKELKAKVAPVGLAWEQVFEAQPKLNLFDADGEHANIRGTYLALCVLYATIFDQSPEGLRYRPVDLLPDSPMVKNIRYQWALSDEEAAFLQRMAWETVQEYQGKP